MLRFIPVFVTSLFLSIHFGVTLYLNSSLLGKFFLPNVVSLLFLLGALGNIIVFLFASKLIARFGKRVMLLLFLIFTVINVLSLALATTPLVLAFAFISYASFLPMTFYCLDIFLEEISKDTKTGEIRGAYLTLLNFGITLGPLSFAFLVQGDMLQGIYLAAILLLIPPILMTLYNFKSKFPKKHHPYHHSPELPFKKWWHNSNIRHVTLARLTLESFFAFMVIYSPVYLHSVLGFDWVEIGIMFTVMLLPFVLFELPVGVLADRLFGEKEIMSIGFLVSGISLLAMPFIGKIFFAWMAILFLSRVGASLVEVTTESYFFKKIEGHDTGLISIFRLARPTSIILGSSIGALVLNIFSFEKIFFIVAIIILFGLKESFSLKDTL